MSSSQTTWSSSRAPLTYMVVDQQTGNATGHIWDNAEDMVRELAQWPSEDLRQVCVHVTDDQGISVLGLEPR